MMRTMLLSVSEAEEALVLKHSGMPAVQLTFCFARIALKGSTADLRICFAEQRHSGGVEASYSRPSSFEEYGGYLLRMHYRRRLHLSAENYWGTNGASPGLGIVLVNATLLAGVLSELEKVIVKRKSRVCAQGWLPFRRLNGPSPVAR